MDLPWDGGAAGVAAESCSVILVKMMISHANATIIHTLND
jgi:hypothetical protein